MKGVIASDHMSTNNFELLMLGMPSLTVVEASGLEDELQTVELPDRTVASGGNRSATEFDISIPAHHKGEIAACEIWLREAQDPVTPTYKKPGTLIMKSLSGNTTLTFSLLGVFCKKRVTPDLEMANEGEQANITYTLSVDDILPPF
jgi:hypothetical protein